MELSEAKHISITNYLIQRGYRWVKKTNKNTSFLSPFRSENSASFVVDNYENSFCDYGNGKHGDIISLVMELDKVSFKEALNILSGTECKKKFFEPKEKKKSVEIISAKPVTTLMSYMTEKRGIKKELVDMYCKQVTYSFPNGRFPNRTYEAIGFENSLGGYELRNEKIKISTDAKSYSVFKKGGDVNIFEGFIDFLSALQYFSVMEFKNTTYVLNGVGMLNVILPFLKGKVNCFVDNDKAGDEVIRKCTEAGLEVNDCRNYYEFANDFNGLYEKP